MNVFDMLKIGVEAVKNTVGAVVGNNTENPQNPSTPILPNPHLVPTGEVPAPPVTLAEEIPAPPVTLAEEAPAPPVTSAEEVPVPDVPVQSTPEAPCMWNKDGTFNRGAQIGFYDYTIDSKTCGLLLDKNNRWVQVKEKLFNDTPEMRELEKLFHEKYEQVSNETPEERYQRNIVYLQDSDETKGYSDELSFAELTASHMRHMIPVERPASSTKKSNAGRKGISFQLALGAVIVRHVTRESLRGTCKLISENAYIQYFCGFTTFSNKNTIGFSTLSELEKVFDLDFMKKINDFFIAQQMDWKNLEEIVQESGNKGSVSIDATADPANAKYPQDFDVINDGRLDTEKLIDKICAETGAVKPRTYKKKLQKTVKDLSKKKNKTPEDIRPVIKELLSSIVRNFGYIDNLCTKTGYEFSPDETFTLMAVKTMYGQQKYMYENNVTRVPHRIVNMSMPFVRPIVRRKVAQKVEFGPKTELSVDEHGFVRLENFEFESFNEGTRLIDAIDRYKKAHGCYPEVVRADQIYRNKENLAFCKAHGIRLSGPKLGRKPKDEKKLMMQIKQEQTDMVDRIEIERTISREKRFFGLDRVMERTPERMMHTISMGVFLDNLIPVGF